MKPAPSIELMTHTQEDISRAKKRKRWLLGCALSCFGVAGLVALAWSYLSSR